MINFDKIVGYKNRARNNWRKDQKTEPQLGATFLLDKADSFINNKKFVTQPVTAGNVSPANDQKIVRFQSACSSISPQETTSRSSSVASSTQKSSI